MAKYHLAVVRRTAGGPPSEVGSLRHVIHPTSILFHPICLGLRYTLKKMSKNCKGARTGLTSWQQDAGPLWPLEITHKHHGVFDALPAAPGLFGACRLAAIFVPDLGLFADV